MKKEFWLERWQRAEIGFHQDEVNPHLPRYWPELKQQSCRVFVPLCGKSLDMLWLRDQGNTVLGVELSEIAVSDFFQQQGISPAREVAGKFHCFEADGIRLLCGDFFDLGKAEMAQVKAVYDRASLVALPPEMRQRYARHLGRYPAARTQILLVTFDYPQEEMEGPPFAVSAEEVRALYGRYAEIRLLKQEDVLEQNPRFKQRGMTRMDESIFLLTLR